MRKSIFFLNSPNWCPLKLDNTKMVRAACMVSTRHILSLFRSIIYLIIETKTLSQSNKPFSSYREQPRFFNKSLGKCWVFRICLYVTHLNLYECKFLSLLHCWSTLGFWGEFWKWVRPMHLLQYNTHLKAPIPLNRGMGINLILIGLTEVLFYFIDAVLCVQCYTVTGVCIICYFFTTNASHGAS